MYIRYLFIISPFLSLFFFLFFFFFLFLYFFFRFFSFSQIFSVYFSFKKIFIFTIPLQMSKLIAYDVYHCHMGMHSQWASCVTRYARIVHILLFQFLPLLFIMMQFNCNLIFIFFKKKIKTFFYFFDQQRSLFRRCSHLGSHGMSLKIFFLFN